MSISINVNNSNLVNLVHNALCNQRVAFISPAS